jgi:hypothetical protein
MKQLRLIAQDEEDLKIISAHLQDAVVKVSDMAYLPHSRRFVIVLNRFCWEDRSAPQGMRARAGLHFDGVLKVQAQNLRQDDANAVLELLAIAFNKGGDAGGSVDLSFAGGAKLRLVVECIDAAMADIGGPWPATARPKHRLDRVDV